MCSLWNYIILIGKFILFSKNKIEVGIQLVELNMIKKLSEGEKGKKRALHRPEADKLLPIPQLGKIEILVLPWHLSQIIY